MSPLLGAGSAILADEPNNPWFSWAYIRNNISTLTDALEQHVTLTVVSVAVAAAIAIPLAVAANRVRWLAAPILASTGVLYTIPSLALFAILGPALGLSFKTAAIGLIMYALLAIARNALTGLQQVPADVRDAATGMGYSRAAMLWRIELPLAMPSIVTGLRIATVSTVALVTVCAIVGYGGFGNVMVNGFNTNYYKPQIMTGALACVGLALIFDLVLIWLGRLAMPWARRGGRA
jgi:osmoprotectant transport system permease protein